MTVFYIRFDCRNHEINFKWQLVSVWVDCRGLIECEINKVSHGAVQRPLNDLYEDDHQGFDGFMLGMKVLFSFGLGSASFFSLLLFHCPCFFQSVCLPLSFCFSIPLSYLACSISFSLFFPVFLNSSSSFILSFHWYPHCVLLCIIISRVATDWQRFLFQITFNQLFGD